MQPELTHEQAVTMWYSDMQEATGKNKEECEQFMLRAAMAYIRSVNAYEALDKRQQRRLAKHYGDIVTAILDEI